MQQNKWRIADDTKLAKMNSDAHNFSLELGSKSAENTGHAVATRSAYVSRDKAEL